MDYLAMVLLGLVQGATEFLPVSSSGHLVLAGELLGHHTMSLRDIVILHLGTLIGMTYYFRHDLLLLLGLRLGGGVAMPTGVPEERGRLWWHLALGTGVTVVVALVARSVVESAFDSLLAVGCGLIVTATALLLSARAARSGATRSVDEMRAPDAVLIGLAQAIAIWPGISRSGVTISVGLALGIRQDQAARFSFLLAFPAIAGATLDSILDGSPTPGAAEIPMVAVLLGAAVAALSGCLALALLFRIFRRTTLAGFAYYCFVAAALALVLHVVR